MRNIIRSINSLLSTLNITILAIIVMCVTWQVVARFIFKSPSIFTDELSRLLFICLGLLVVLILPDKTDIWPLIFCQ